MSVEAWLNNNTVCRSCGELGKGNSVLLLGDRALKGKTIRIFLVDGVPGGTLTAEIINWSGKIIVAPRSQLAELGKRDEAVRTGAYCLVGPDPDTSETDIVW